LTEADAIALAQAPEGFGLMTPRYAYSALNGPVFERREAEGTVLAFRVLDKHCNAWGDCHGGWMASFCDILLGLNLRRRLGVVGPTVSLSLHYMASAPKGAWVEGRAEILKATRSLAFVQGLVDVDGAPAARADAVFRLSRRALAALGEV
jgi:acyl-coenzyme A thioesterase PaaI-like protein